MKIGRRVLKAISAHSRETMPDECCGILVFRRGDPCMVDDAIPAKNAVKACPEEAYVLDHKTHMKALELEISGEAGIAGYYHSHPHGGTAMSKRDAMLAVEGVAYLIVGSEDGQDRYAAWKLEEKEFVEEPLEVVE